MFENNTRNYRIYQEGAFLGDVVSDLFIKKKSTRPMNSFPV